jgi:Tol biopolymer transport system component
MAGRGGIHLASLDDPKRLRVLVADITNPQYLAPQQGSAVGHLLFVRGGTLMAQPVDPETMDNKGELFPVAQQISRGTLFGTNLYSVSETGVLVYLNRGGAGASTQHVWRDRAGKESEKLGGPLRSRNTFALSPDGKRVVVELIAGDEADSDLWLIDREHGGTETRLTFDASINYYPVWSPDGSKIAFASNRKGGNFNLYQRATNGTGQDELLFESKDPGQLPWGWSPDGRFLLYRVQDAKNGYALWALPVMGQGEKKPFVVRDSPFLESQDQLSPDGRWLAYTSNESGDDQVDVVPFAPAFDKPITGKWQISAAGGTQPRWRGDGKELYYVAPDRKLMAVEVKATPLTFDWGTPQPLFDLRSYIDASNAFLWGYVPSADGKRFLVAEIPGTNSDAPPPPMTVVVNWLGSVKK